jgi:preprotein translocase subunit secB
MSQKNSPVIEFMGYRVSDIQYHCLPELELQEEHGSYRFNFSKSNTVLSETAIQENVRVCIFWGEDEAYENSQFQLTIEIAGRFRCPSGWQEKWETNALAIMFPYLRSLVSMITCNSGREPIILPTINLSRLFE